MSAPAVSESTAASATPEGLPDLSKLPEEERDAAWVKHYYRGDDVPQLTIRAVVMGGLLGAAMSVSNLYTTLKLGWAFGVAITACVLSYAIWNAFVSLRIAKTKMTLLENNCMQSTASAAGYSTGGTLATAVGALLLITGQQMHWFPVAIWVLLTALLGVFLAIPMKRQMINSEQLPFPSGIAAAETLRSLYAAGRESVLKARALIAALATGIVVALVRSFGYMPEQIFLNFPVVSARSTVLTGKTLGMWFEPSLLLIAAGMIVGLRVSTWMLVGSLINYVALAPAAMGVEDWVEAPKRFFGHMEVASNPGVEFGPGSTELDGAQYDEAAATVREALASSGAIEAIQLTGMANQSTGGTAAIATARAEHLRDALVERGVPADRIRVGEPTVAADGAPMVGWTVIAPSASELHERPIIAMIRVTRWSLWLGTALLVASGLTSFALGYRTILRAIRNVGKKKDGANADPVERLEVPASWLLIGGVPVTIGLTLLCWLSFGIAPWLGLVSVVLSFVLALVACRATGETDTTPIGAMGKITQFTYAVLAPANTTVNLMTAGITAGAAGSSADLLTDLKSGYLLGANPRKQFLAQFFGVFFGVIAVVPAWFVLVPDREHLEAFNSPATTMWYAVAQALSRGVETIPESARLAIVIGGLVGIVLALAEGLAPKSIKKWMPSSMGLGLAFVVPFANALSFFIGAVIAELWMRFGKETGERYIIPLASGAVAGESLAAALFAMLAATGLVGGH
ncbi:OPT family oligopeptide transporter [Sandaracinus amylolyticus]|nr:OPT family oligopeptide transporter [Sandaracinus amylolyticus]